MKTSTEADYNELRKAFVIGNMFHEDPRFGLITLSEIASRALSAVNPRYSNSNNQ
jgi:uncharacterized membrane protein